MPSTGSRRTEGFVFVCLFFPKSHRENPPLVLFAAVSADSGAATPPKIPFGHGENLPNRGGEETGAAAPIKAFAYTFPTWVLPKKGGGNFCKKKAFFDSGMATTTIVENLCGITNCSFFKKGGSVEVSYLCLACHCVLFQEFHVLCLLEIGGKGAGGGGSIQSRQSKWAVTVQH